MNSRRTSRNRTVARRLPICASQCIQHLKFWKALTKLLGAQHRFCILDRSDRRAWRSAQDLCQKGRVFPEENVYQLYSKRSLLDWLEICCKQNSKHIQACLWWAFWRWAIDVRKKIQNDVSLFGFVHLSIFNLSTVYKCNWWRSEDPWSSVCWHFYPIH